MVQSAHWYVCLGAVCQGVNTLLNSYDQLKTAPYLCVADYELSARRKVNEESIVSVSEEDCTVNSQAYLEKGHHVEKQEGRHPGPALLEQELYNVVDGQW